MALCLITYADKCYTENIFLQLYTLGAKSVACVNLVIAMHYDCN